MDNLTKILRRYSRESGNRWRSVNQEDGSVVVQTNAAAWGWATELDERFSSRDSAAIILQGRADGVLRPRGQHWRKS